MLDRDLPSKFKTIRINLRKNYIQISENVFRRMHPSNTKKTEEICVFCNTQENITKEHIIPKWVFERDTNLSFISKTNKQTQTYNKSTIPACRNCNNTLLSSIEKNTKETVRNIQSKKNLTLEDYENLIRWMEIIDYKLQVHDLRTKFLKYGKDTFDKEFGMMPRAIIRDLIFFNVFKTRSFLRNSQRRITVKSKHKKLNSLVIFRTKEPYFGFFNNPNEYVFISFPMFNIAFFYFLRKEWADYDNATEEARYIMKKVSET